MGRNPVWGRSNRVLTAQGSLACVRRGMRIVVAEDFEKLADRPESALCARLRSSGEERAIEGTVKNPANYYSLFIA